MNKFFRQACFALFLLLVAIILVYHIISDQRRADSNRQLVQQNIELQQNIDSLTKRIEQDEGYIRSLQQNVQKENVSRGGERAAYNLTPSERDLVERVVMAEAEGEPYKGQMLVAQCILNACRIDGIRPAIAVKKYAYARSRPEPSGSVIKAVSAVFDRGETVVDEPIVYFYAPARVRSEFHEAQRFVCEIGGHRFFKEIKNAE